MTYPDIDLTNLDVFVEGTPHEWFRRLRREDPVYWHPERAGAGFWCITKYEDVKTVSRNPKLFSSARGTQLRDPTEEERAQMESRRGQFAAIAKPGPGMSKEAPSSVGGGIPIMLNMDPPEHVKFRRIVQRVFTPRLVGEQEAHIRDLARRIVDAVAPRGKCEFVEDVAAELPLQVICEMMAVPQEDRKDIFDLSNQMIGAEDPDLGAHDQERIRSAFIGMFLHAMKVAQRYRDAPAENLSSRLLHYEVDGEKLSEIEYCAFFLLLCVAGNETTRTVTTNGMRVLMEHPDQLEQLVRDPSLIPSAVEEILRFAPAVHHFRRTATEDTELRGKKIRAGDKVVLWYPSANRDEDVFPEPDRFDIRRTPNEHLAFGIGEHFCMGANLARLELRVAFAKLAERLDEIELAGPIARLHSSFVGGIKRVPIRYRLAPRAA
jgi:cytochrome P450